MNKEFDRANSSTAPKSVRHLASKLLISLGVLVALSGCASYYGAAKISSVPAGAEVINLKDGTILGVTPTTVWWQDGNSDRQHISLRIKLDGYYDKVAPFWLSMRHQSQGDAMASPQVVDTVLQQRGD
ncbi:MAG TPA: hypothetical protein DCW52_13915 [Gammaproteobacteria bacterium]|nr:hypothetical protein [Gammaproteobacteria bacterium]